MELTPEKLELVRGYLLDTEQQRLELLSILLTNVGLKKAVKLAAKEKWREAIRSISCSFL